MSAEDDRLVLVEYEQWRNARAGHAPDLTVKAFLVEREGRFNTSRIADALFTLNRELPAFQALDDKGLQFSADALLVLTVIRSTLEGDREFVENQTLSGATTRTYL